MMDIHRCLEVLEVGPEADADQITQSYRDLAAIWHPDRHGHNPRLQRRAEEKLKEINAAYAILKTHLAAGKPIGSPSPAPVTATPVWTEAVAARHQAGKTFFIWRLSRRLLWWAAVGLALAAGLEYGPWFQDQVRKATAVYNAPSPVPSFQAPAKVIAEQAAPPPKPTSAPMPPPPRQVLIYLTDGTVIQTAACWEKDDMLLYRKAGGVIGIRKAKVARIEKPSP